MKNFQIILGLGQTGFSLARYLAPQHKNIIVCDTRSQPPQLAAFKKAYPDIPVYCGPLQADLILQAERILISPGLSVHEPLIAQAIKKGIPIVSDIQLFADAAQAPIVGITGTNAKGTVTTLLALIAERAGKEVLIGGNIGTPALDLLTHPTPDLYILELSSFQLESTQHLPLEAATILNVSVDHLDHHRDMEEYIAAKQRIYQHAKHCIFNRADSNTYPPQDDKTHWSFALDSPKNDREYGYKKDKHQGWLMHGDQVLLPAHELQISGLHNIENALAALALGSAIGLPQEPMLHAIREFKGLRHRCEFVRQHQGVRWYNDSKATNIGATMAALKGLAHDAHQKIILIAGGDGKSANFDELRPLIKAHVATAILLGKDAPLLEKSWQGVTQIELVPDLSSAVTLAAQLAQENDIVLLSPACSSLDMFKNFEERGEMFVKYVEQL
jgi:UDP-N-acetylmuramoylalanine--D-glutamate ligase